MKKIFISHISIETELAQRVKSNLETHFLGLFEIFVSSDRESITAGSNWLKEVEDALKGADIAIILCSEESVNRPWVNFEAGAAWIRDLLVIPLCHSGLKVNDLPSPMNFLQSVECSDPIKLQKLYDAISKVLLADIPNLKIPEVGFVNLAQEFAEIEKKYIQLRHSFETIINPRILCGVSKQYGRPDYGFSLDLAALNETFPGLVEVERDLTSRRISKLLTSHKYDILHLVLAVDPDDGSLIFDEVDNTTRKPISKNPDTISAEGFAVLLRESNTKLVVLATCKALLLAVDVAHVANMAASDADITGMEAAEWEKLFYGFLSDGIPLYKAFELTRNLSDTPIRAIRKKDIVFSLSGL